MKGTRYKISPTGGGDRPWQLIRIRPNGEQAVAVKDMDEDEATTVLAAIEDAMTVEVAA